MTNRETATEILQLVGGESNISFVTHCATRLRFVLKDSEKADLGALDRVEGVLKAQNKGGQLQVVIGAKVNKVYDELCDMVHLNMEQQPEKKKQNWFNAFFEMIISIITPVMPPLMGSGMIKCIALLITTFGWLDANSGFMAILNMTGDALFYFFPFFLAVSAAKRFHTNVFMAVTLAACLMHPTILEAAKVTAQTGVTSINFLGASIPLVKYSSTLIPIIIAVWVLSKVFPVIEKYTPEIVRSLFAPMITLLIMVPLELIVIGPIGYYGGNIVGVMIQNLYAAGGILSGFLLGFFRPILVMFGMHYAIQPIMIQQISDLGYTTLGPSSYVANMAQAGAVFAVFLMTREKTMKSVAGSSAVSAVFGITEPAIYGVNLKYKKPFFAGCLAAGIMSAFYSIGDIHQISFVLPNILSVTTLQSEYGAFMGLLGAVLAFVLAMVFTIIICKKDFRNTLEPTVSEPTALEVQESPVFSPLDGEVVALSQVDDKMFSQELLGKGAAILPTSGEVYAPFDGEVQAMFKTNHAIGLRNEKGVELLIHVGMDTVNLEGKYFTPKVTQGQKVKKGELLVSFDLEAIKKEGYDVITPVIVTNTADFEAVLSVAQGTIQHGEPLLDVE